MITTYYLMLAMPSLVLSPFPALILLPFLWLPRSRMKAILLFSILLSASLVLDHTSYNLTQREEEVKEIGVVALEDGMVKKNGKYGFCHNDIFF